MRCLQVLPHPHKFPSCLPVLQHLHKLTWCLQVLPHLCKSTSCLPVLQHLHQPTRRLCIHGTAKYYHQCQPLVIQVEQPRRKHTLAQWQTFCFPSVNSILEDISRMPISILWCTGPPLIISVIQHKEKDYYHDRNGSVKVSSEANHHCNCQRSCITLQHPYFHPRFWQVNSKRLISDGHAHFIKQQFGFTGNFRCLERRKRFLWYWWIFANWLTTAKIVCCGVARQVARSVHYTKQLLQQLN